MRLVCWYVNMPVKLEVILNEGLRIYTPLLPNNFQVKSNSMVIKGFRGMCYRVGITYGNFIV